MPIREPKLPILLTISTLVPQFKMTRASCAPSGEIPLHGGYRAVEAVPSFATLGSSQGGALLRNLFLGLGGLSGGHAEEALDVVEDQVVDGHEQERDERRKEHPIA